MLSKLRVGKAPQDPKMKAAAELAAKAPPVEKEKERPDKRRFTTRLSVFQQSMKQTAETFSGKQAIWNLMQRGKKGEPEVQAEEEEEEEDDSPQVNRGQTMGLEDLAPPEDDYDEYDEGSESETTLEESMMEEEPEEEIISPRSEGSIDLMDLVREVHPQYLSMQVAKDAEEKAIQARINKKAKFNLPLMRGGESGPAQATKMRIPPPRQVLVGGHDGSYGNVTINGIYEAMTGSFGGRPWFRKVLHRHTGPMTKAECQKTDLNFKGTAYTTKTAPNFGDASWTYMTKSQDQKYLYFDDRQGRWCIGKAPGGKRCFARCNGPAAAIPHRLTTWQVWDVEQGEWYLHPSMYCEKCGS